MISRIKGNGILIHGIVDFESNPGFPDNVITSVKYDPAIHEIERSPLDYKVIAYRVFYHHLQRRGITCFHKSKLFKEDLCIKMMFKSPAIFNRLIPQMLRFNILTRDGRMFRLGVCP